ncbi:retrovirus-related pol polyprotein from transposon TNT 1-94 [Tanacetum coccineum]|uniref:Retrovirus-related pol polyprotein from transposon TNT 1-94 n=1 Tax=Tanacetum coccineum TaxID=301880 RepID=A0ABQ5IAD3_9ASTR
MVWHEPISHLSVEDYYEVITNLLILSSKNKSWLWHRRLNHLNFGTLNDLARKDLVRGLPRLKFEKDHLCSACQLGKSRKATHKPKMINTIMEVLHTLHMDLCGPLRVQSINGKKYILVIVDDYSRFTWVKFLRSKDETPAFVINLLKQLQVGLNKTVQFVRTDNGTEFVNKLFDLNYYESVGITHEKTVPRTPQQNGVLERRNRTLIEVARTMLIFSKAPLFLWAEAVATACYTQNRSLIHTLHDKTPYELVHDKKPDLSLVTCSSTSCLPSEKAPLRVKEGTSGVVMDTCFQGHSEEVHSGSDQFLGDIVSKLVIKEATSTSISLYKADTSGCLMLCPKPMMRSQLSIMALNTITFPLFVTTKSAIALAATMSSTTENDSNSFFAAWHEEYEAEDIKRPSG